MSTTDHPLTDTAAAELWDAIAPNFNTMTTSQMSRLRFVECIKAVIRDAFDAGREHERTTPAAGADRPWEPLTARRVHVGDEVRQDLCNVTVIAVVGEVDEGGDPRTAEGRLIGLLRHGTWWVRRPVQELPTEDGAVIVPAEGSEFIEQVGDCANYRRLTYDAASGRWIGWDTLNHEAEALSPEYITPGTWKLDGE